MDLTTEPKMRKKLKGSHLGAWYVVLKFIWFHYILMHARFFKTEVFLMLMATGFLQNDVLIWTFNLPVLFVIGIFITHTFCSMHFQDIACKPGARYLIYMKSILVPVRMRRPGFVSQPGLVLSTVNCFQLMIYFFNF